MKLEGKVAIVTGAARGFGKAFCLRLAEEGAKVVAADIRDVADTVAGVEAKGGAAIGLKVDVSSEADTRRMAEETVKKFGRIDILINNAADFNIKIGPFYEIDPDEWDRVMAVNVKGQWLSARAVFPQMKKQGKGKIVNMGSSSFIGGSGPFPHYVASKGAIIGLTRAMARDLGEYGINVNVLAPGFALTEGGYELMERGLKSGGVQRRCFKRDEQPEDVLGAMVFLCSEDSDFMSGQTMVVDGGGSFI